MVMVYNLSTIRHLTSHIPSLVLKATICFLNFHFFVFQYLENR